MFHIIKSLISIVEFIVIAIVSFVLAPYLITAEHYGKAETVHPLFPIAIAENGKCDVVLWNDYKKSPEKYSHQLVTLPSSDVFTGCATANGHFSISKYTDDNYQLTYYGDDYTFWSDYSIVAGVVEPTSFRFRGALVVTPVFFIALLGAAMLNWVVRRYLARRG